MNYQFIDSYSLEFRRKASFFIFPTQKILNFDCFSFSQVYRSNQLMVLVKLH